MGNMDSILYRFRDMADHKVLMDKDEFIKRVSNMFLTAPRSGEEKDDPEGVRYIQISETLSNDIVDMANRLIDG